MRDHCRAYRPQLPHAATKSNPLFFSNPKRPRGPQLVPQQLEMPATGMLDTDAPSQQDATRFSRAGAVESASRAFDQLRRSHSVVKTTQCILQMRKRGTKALNTAAIKQWREKL